MKRIELPMTRECAALLRAGDAVMLSGVIHTARDAAHAKLISLIENGGILPFDIEGATVYYTGPTPAPPGRAIGSVGPTTSYRMDSFTPALLKLGMRAMIGKGERSAHVAESCKKYGGIYFLSIGGASALISDDVKSVEVVAYDDLGTESIKKLKIENLRLIVGIDSEGGDFFAEERKKYRIL